MVYQTNLTQQFKIPNNIISEKFYLNLTNVSPSEYSAYLNIEETENFSKFSIMSSSPELFIESDGNYLLTSPIKGTNPRREDYELDQESKNELLNSYKDHAELAMIVDLERNDLGKIAKTGSVEVIEHARLETLPQVYHLISDIKCVLKQDIKLSTIIKSLFPSGSITGAPKIAAMNYISDLENTSRGIYTGAIGYFGTQGHLKFNVAIRTALSKNSNLYFQSGGGVVLDSDPENEYQESITKAKGIYLSYVNYELND